jgi:hypothetical protein
MYFGAGDDLVICRSFRNERYTHPRLSLLYIHINIVLTYDTLTPGLPFPRSLGGCRVARAHHSRLTVDLSNGISLRSRYSSWASKLAN